MTRKSPRVDARDLLLVAVSSFVLTIQWMPRWLPEQIPAHETISRGETAVDPSTSRETATTAAPPSSAAAAFARWQAEVTEIYAAADRARAATERATAAWHASEANPLTATAATPVAPTSFAPTSFAAAVPAAARPGAGAQPSLDPQPL
ncbi:MAG: hypothetical protein ACF788_04735, partial [Novipirellula sp. JB048]